MIRPCLATIATVAGLLMHSAPAGAQTRGVAVPGAGDSEVDPGPIYGASRALVIGIDAYSGGWPRLANAVGDAELVAAELGAQGFDVTLRKDLDAGALKEALERFFVVDGADPQARLFVWFAGHGHTEDGLGFLVPADAPRPGPGPEFRLKALSLRRFGEFVRLARAKHALAVFDACFAGTIFASQRSAPPAAISRATGLPVRQFVSSGDADQEVTHDGRFRKLFLRALRGEAPADANGDGYLTGSELGMFLTDRVTNLTEARQTPRYGKLNDEDFDRGDFVFALSAAASTPRAPRPPAPHVPPSPPTSPAPEGGAFEAAVAELSGTAFKERRLALIEELAASRRLTCAQVARLLEHMPHRDGRGRALQVLAPRITDPENVGQVLQALKFRREKERARKLIGGR